MVMQTTKGCLDLSDGKLYYETAGAGDPLVLSHAAFLDSRMFNAQWDVLAQRFRVIRYDMRGFGQSGSITAPVPRRDDLRSLLEHLGVTRAHFIGCSNAITLDLTLEQPDLVASLILVGAAPGGFELQGEPPRYMFELFEALQQGNVDRAAELQIRILLDGQFREPNQVDPVLRARALEMTRLPVERGPFLVEQLPPAQPLDPPAIARLEEVTCPFLAVVGALEHPEVIRAARVMVERIPNAQMRVIPDAGHVPSFEQPDRFNQLMLEFLPNY